MLDAILTDGTDVLEDDLELLAFDDDEVGARLVTFAEVDPDEETIQAVMAEAGKRLGEVPMSWRLPRRT
jgi:hypothetical protein